MESIFAQPDDSLFLALPKAAARLALSIVRSGKYLTDAYADALFRVATADALWTLCLILAAWALATIVGGPLALAVDGFLIAYGLYSLYEQLAATWAGLRAWAGSAYYARSDEQLDAAAKAFAATVAAGSLDLLIVLLTHKVFAKVQRTLASRFPKPNWLEEELASAKQRRAKSPAGLATDLPRVPAEGSPLRRLTEPALNAGRAAGARQLSQSALTIPVAILGGSIVLGVGAALTAVAMGGSHGRQK